MPLLYELDDDELSTLVTTYVLPPEDAWLYADCATDPVQNERLLAFLLGSAGYTLVLHYEPQNPLYWRWQVDVSRPFRHPAYPTFASRASAHAETYQRAVCLAALAATGQDTPPMLEPAGKYV